MLKETDSAWKVIGRRLTSVGRAEATLRGDSLDIQLARKALYVDKAADVSVVVSFYYRSRGGCGGMGIGRPNSLPGLGNGTVDACRPDGCLIQSLPYAGAEPDDDNRDYFAFVEDMNFDGLPDVGILFSQGLHNIYYDCWLWRKEAGCFVRYEDMRGVADPRFDRERERVLSFEHISATDNTETEYAWENGRLLPAMRTIREVSGDNGNIVVRRFIRGDCQPTEGGACEDEEVENAYYRPDLSGLNLFLYSPSDTLDVAVLPNGEWWSWRADEDRTLFIESRRMPALDHEKEAVEHLVWAEWPLARETMISPFPALAEKLAYPAFKAEFLDGENEDARQFVAALVFADEWSFWFVLNASVDARLDSDADADADAVVGNERLRKDMEKLLLGIEAIDPADGDFLPSFGIPVYLAGADSPLRISVMGALVQIKKVVDPERFFQIGDDQIAYRYDGPGTVSGRPVLFFSFGADSREKFTAERHFAVDVEGLVYEMDVLEGGEYRLWEDHENP